ncbi:MAG: hypothetical protein AB2594_20880, partial [Candidatus Thiodiazotropha sp.]|nr:hypothetical protein [Candidatus Thiodiazotropha sp. (ex Lucina pensylvanica)]
RLLNTPPRSVPETLSATAAKTSTGSHVTTVGKEPTAGDRCLFCHHDRCSFTVGYPDSRSIEIIFYKE